MNKVSFSVEMRAKDIFRFMMYHSYSRISGILGVMFSIASIVILISSFNVLEERNKAVLILVAMWFLVIEPLTLHSRSKSQAKTNAAYKKPLNYDVDENGITVSQDEQRQTIEWERLSKIVKTRNLYLVYSSRIHAFIFPIDQIGDSCEALEKMFVECTKGTKVKLPSRIRKSVGE